MKVYETKNYGPTIYEYDCVEIKWTEKTVTIGSRRHNIVGSYSRFWKTREEAKAYLVDRTKLSIKVGKEHLARLERNLVELESQ